MVHFYFLKKNRHKMNNFAMALSFTAANALITQTASGKNENRKLLCHSVSTKIAWMLF